VARIVVIADDLTGAADCAASSAALGFSATVLLHSPHTQQSNADWPDTDILSIDANSRCLPAKEASELTTQLVRLCDSHKDSPPGYVLLKKIDSTLRGNVAGELAALLHARRSASPANAKLSLLMAPALPVQGRTTVAGRLLVHGVPLEKTDIWRSEDRTPQSDILKLLAVAGLSCGLLTIEMVRSGLTDLRHAIQQSAKDLDVVVCDAETDADLRAIAEASLGQPALTALIGSAGLASQIPLALGIAPKIEPTELSFAPGPALFVVGTAASVSLRQASILETTSEIATFHATPSALFTSPILKRQIIQSLQSSHDVLLMIDARERCSDFDGQFLSQSLSHLLLDCHRLLGGLVATGGETARAALDALRIHQLRLLGEIEPGLPFSVADHWPRALPVITKAGAFGTPQSLLRCREFLRNLSRAPERLYTNDSLHHEN
jgi:uncharacterized protein YgbK (DUF1537 family)